MGVQTIAALYVATNGCYFGLPDVDPWDEPRDARKYNGPHPVVAHPPCQRWCRMAGLVEARWGYKRGDDGGTFAHALDCVRCFGGVLEHPAYSDAWKAHGLNHPHRAGGWVAADFVGGWTCHVEQWHYGHRAKKATWLYAASVDLPPVIWGSTPDTAVVAYVTDGGGKVKYGDKARLPAPVSWCGNDVKSGEVRPRLGQREANATPLAFRDLLLSIARSARRAD